MTEKRFEKIVEYYQFDEFKKKWIIFFLGAGLSFISTALLDLYDPLNSIPSSFFVIGVFALVSSLFILLIGFLESRYVFYREIKR